MWEVVWLIEAKLHSHHPGHFSPYPVLSQYLPPAPHQQSFDVEAIVPMLYGLQQLGPQHAATRVCRQVDLGRARVHVGQVVVVATFEQLERDWVLEPAAR